VSEPIEGCRIDIWLWRARLCKTRALAARMSEEGHVEISRAGAWVRLEKPSRLVRPGDALALTFAGRRVELRVAALGSRRGPAPEARGLYGMAENSGGDPTRRAWWED
jgi:ribosome-associated heat shock protein Hsp15